MQAEVLEYLLRPLPVERDLQFALSQRDHAAIARPSTGQQASADKNRRPVQFAVSLRCGYTR